MCLIELQRFLFDEEMNLVHDRWRIDRCGWRVNLRSGRLVMATTIEEARALGGAACPLSMNDVADS